MLFIVDIMMCLFLGNICQVPEQCSICLGNTCKGSCVCNNVQTTFNCYCCCYGYFVPWWYSSYWKV